MLYYEMNLVEVMLTIMLSLGFYYGVGFLNGKLCYKNGYVHQKCMNIGVLIGIEYVNIHNNLGWGRLIHACAANPVQGAIAVVELVAITMVVCLIANAGTRHYNKLRFQKEVKWLI